MTEKHVFSAEAAQPGRIYKFWSDEFGVVKGERLGRGRGRFRNHVFFRGEYKKRDGESRTVVVRVHSDDNVKLVPVKELGE